MSILAYFTYNINMKFFIYLLFFLGSVSGDILKENYIIFDVNGSNPKVILDFESDNLDKFIDLDANKNGLISWKEIKVKKQEIVQFVLPHIKISTDGKICKNSLVDFQVYRRVHQSYIKLHIDLLCPAPKNETKIFYNLFFDVDREQKAFFSIKNQNSSQPMMLSTHTKEISVKLQQSSPFQSFMNFLLEGIWHIWIGFDHILFLLMLLIPSVIYYKSKEIVPQSSLKKTLLEVLKIVTAFSVAHSITLALSVLNIVDVNMQFVEIAIALSVFFTALNNIFVWVSKRVWLVAFSFGLIHGFGFANVLKEMVLTSAELVRTLLGFNLGVEIGQIAIVICIVPLLFALRKTLFYRFVILYGLSVIAGVISLLWAYERYFNLSILPF